MTESQNYSFDVLTNTPKKTVQYSVYMSAVNPESLNEFVKKQTFEDLCRTGCPNYRKKWSCPPFAPAYQDFIKGFRYLYVFYMKFDMEQFSYIGHDFLKIKAAHHILKSRAERFLRRMAPKYGTYISGSCRLCKSCKCREGQPCAHPELMSYSFEALGADIGALTERLFQRKLLWYKRGSLPEYTSFVCGLLTNTPVPFETLREEFLKVN